MTGIIKLHQDILIENLLSNRVDHQPAAAFQILQGKHDRFPHRCGIDDGIQWFRRRFFGISGPDGPNFPCKRLFGRASGEHETPTFREPVIQHFQHKMGGCTESGQAQRLAVLNLRQPQRAVPDSPGTQQRRSLEIGETFGNGIGKIFPGNHEFGVAAVHISSSGSKRRAQIFVASPTERAGSACTVYPADADPIARLKSGCKRAAGNHTTDHLVAGDYRKMGWRGAPFDLVQFRMTDTTGSHLNQDFPIPGFRNADLHQRERFAARRDFCDAGDGHCFHRDRDIHKLHLL